MSLAKAVPRLIMAGSRQLHSTRVIQKSAAYGELSPKLRANQKLFQAENDLPVHLKGGVKDQLLYRFSFGLTMGLFTYSMYVILDLAYKE